MTLLAVARITGTGVTAAAPTQLTAWTGKDTISATDIGERGVIVEVANGSGGPLDLRVGDPGTTPAGNAAADGYATHTIADGAKKRVLVTKANVVAASQVAEIGASTTDAAFTVTCYAL